MKESKSKEQKNKDFKKEIEEQSKVLKELIEKFHLQEETEETEETNFLDNDNIPLNNIKN